MNSLTVAQIRTLSFFFPLAATDLLTAAILEYPELRLSV